MLWFKRLSLVLLVVAMGCAFLYCAQQQPAPPPPPPPPPVEAAPPPPPPPPPAENPELKALEEKLAGVDTVEKGEALLKEIDAFLAKSPEAPVAEKANQLKADVTKKIEELKAAKGADKKGEKKTEKKEEKKTEKK